MRPDQVKIPHFACIEVLVNRQQAIECSHVLGAADLLDYSGAAYCQGIRESVVGTIIDPFNARYTSDCLHLEHEIHRSTERGGVLGVPVHACDIDTLEDWRPPNTPEHRRQREQSEGAPPSSFFFPGAGVSRVETIFKGTPKLDVSKFGCAVQQWS